VEGTADTLGTAGETTPQGNRYFMSPRGERSSRKSKEREREMFPELRGKDGKQFLALVRGERGGGIEGSL